MTLFNKRDYVSAETFWSPDRIAADILRIEDGMLVEHWDVIQDEETQEQSKSGMTMFGDKFLNSSGTT